MKKTKVKFLLTFIVMLVAICLIGTGKVNATSNLLNNIPDTIEAGITTKQAMQGNLVSEELENVVTSYITEDINNYYLSIGFYGNTDADTNIFDISKLRVTIITKTEPPTTIEEKIVNVKYNDTNWNEKDKQELENKLKGIDLTKLSRITNYEYDIEKEEKMEDFCNLVIKTECNKLLNDSSLGYEFYPIQGDWDTFTGYVMQGMIAISKNNVIYYQVGRTNINANATLTIPDNIEDTEQAYIDYALPIIKDKLNQSTGGKGTLISIEKGTEANEFIINYDYIEKSSATIILKKANNTEVSKTINITDNTTNIKLESNTSVIPNDTVLEVKPITDGIILSTVKESLNGISTEFKIYDITLKSNGTEIQPNGKVKISIPIPSDYNKDRLEVYRIADNGEKIKYEITIEGDYATFETDHFSTYVLAEKEEQQEQATNNEQTSNEHKLDETPKTGSTSVLGIIIAIAVTSLAGIVIIKKNNK